MIDKKEGDWAKGVTLNDSLRGFEVPLGPITRLDDENNVVMPNFGKESDTNVA